MLRRHTATRAGQSWPACHRCSLLHEYVDVTRFQYKCRAFRLLQCPVQTTAQAWSQNTYQGELARIEIPRYQQLWLHSAISPHSKRFWIAAVSGKWAGQGKEASLSLINYSNRAGTVQVNSSNGIVTSCILCLHSCSGLQTQRDIVQNWMVLVKQGNASSMAVFTPISVTHRYSASTILSRQS